MKRTLERFGLATALACLAGAGCAKSVVAPEELVLAAASVSARENANAVAAAHGFAPLGEAPVIVESKFTAEHPSGLCEAEPTEGCELDLVDGVGAPAPEPTPVGREEAVRFVGWAADTRRKEVPPIVVVELAGARTYYAGAVRLTSRSDVARVYATPAFAHAGWDLLATLDGVDPGAYVVNVLSVTTRGAVLRCRTHRAILVP